VRRRVRSRTQHRERFVRFGTPGYMCYFYVDGSDFDAKNGSTSSGADGPRAGHSQSGRQEGRAASIDGQNPRQRRAGDCRQAASPLCWLWPRSASRSTTSASTARWRSCSGSDRSRPTSVPRRRRQSMATLIAQRGAADEGQRGCWSSGRQAETRASRELSQAKRHQPQNWVLQPAQVRARVKVFVHEERECVHIVEVSLSF
jgi:hypothetical protein